MIWILGYFGNLDIGLLASDVGFVLNLEFRALGMFEYVRVGSWDFLNLAFCVLGDFWGNSNREI